MKNLNLPQLFIITLLILFNSCNTYSQNNKEKAFLKLAENLSKLKELNDYKDRTLSKDFKNKLIISDLKDNPIFKSMVERDEFLVSSNEAILKSDAKFYVMPSKVIISKDSCYLEFEVINKYNMKINGVISLIPTKPSDLYDFTNFKTRSTISSERIK